MSIEPEEPLHLALALIFSRNDDFVLEIYKSGYAPLNLALDEFNRSRTQKIVPAVSTVDEAWSLLREKVVGGSIELRGIPFRKGADVEEIGLFSTPYELEKDVRPAGLPPKQIKPDVTASLVLDYATTEIRLRPADWLRTKGLWWRGVRT